MKRGILEIAGLALFLLALNLILNRVLFLPGERIYRESIEPGYASMARFVAEHPNPWTWKPEQYCGLPAQHAYLPVLPYVTAAGIWLMNGVEAARVYRLITVFLACLGPVTLFFLIFYFTRDRWCALAAGFIYSFFSPFYVWLPKFSADAGIAQLPSRLHVQIKYGEAPHTAGLMLLPLALIAIYAVAKNRRYWQFFLAAVLLAAVALTNWVAALALTWCVIVMAISAVWPGESERFSLKWVAGAAVAAYLLSAFWLTPGYVATIAANWPRDAFNYRVERTQDVLLFGLIAGVILLRLLLRRFRAGFYACFTALCFFTFAYVVLAFNWFSLEAIPESRRYLPEAELFAILFAFEIGRQALRGRSLAARIAVVAIVVFALAPGARQMWRYASKTGMELTPVPKERTPEFRVASELAGRKPSGRVFVTGGTRFHLNSWFDVPQVGGTFETGIRNRVPLDFAYQITSGLGNAPGREGATAVMQLRTLGVEYVAVHGPQSKEFFRDFRNAQKFEGLLERVWEHDGDAIFRVPFRSYASLVRKDELPSRLPVGADAELLARYAGSLDDPSRPALATRWKGTSEMEIQGALPPGMLVSARVSYDEGWTAWQDGVEIPVERDINGFMLLEPKPGGSPAITLRYGPSGAQKAAAAISILSWVAGLAGLVFLRRTGVAALSKSQAR